MDDPDSYVKRRLRILRDAKVGKLQHMIAVEELSSNLTAGLSEEALEAVFLSLDHIKLSALRVELLQRCLPSDTVSQRTVDVAISVLCKRKTELGVKHALLDWLLVGVQHFFTAQLRHYLRTYYTFIFHLVRGKSTMGATCALLTPLTEAADVLPSRCQVLMQLTSPDVGGSCGTLWALVRKYHQLKPHLVQRVIPQISLLWHQLNKQIGQSVERWLTARSSTDAAAAAADTGDLWDMRTHQRGSRAAREGVAVLPQPLPASFRERQVALPSVTAFATLEEASSAATLGLRPASQSTALLLSRERRALLLLSTDVEHALSQASLDLVCKLRGMLRRPPAHFSLAQLVRQLVRAGQVGLPLSSLRGLFRCMLEGARPEQPAAWLPALQLLPFYGWRPFQALQEELLRPLLELVLRCDHNVRLHMVVALTELVVRLAEEELPRVQQRVFPYTTRPALEEISECGDVHVEVGRVAEHAFNICQELAVSVEPAENLIRATLGFCLQVSPVLLEAGVPVVPQVRRDLLYRVLLGNDVIALDQLMLLFSRYREFAAKLSMRSSQLISRTSEASSRAMERAQTSIHDVRRLVYGRRTGRLGADLAEEVRSALLKLYEDTYLPNHPALFSFVDLLDEEAEVDLPLVEEVLSENGLVGFSAFSKEFI